MHVPLSNAKNVVAYCLQAGACRGLVMPGENTWLYAPLPNFIDECEKYRHSKTTCPELCHVQKNYPIKTSSQVRI